jgi:hypothetical protein
MRDSRLDILDSTKDSEMSQRDVSLHEFRVRGDGVTDDLARGTESNSVSAH